MGYQILFAQSLWQACAGVQWGTVLFELYKYWPKRNFVDNFLLVWGVRLLSCDCSWRVAAQSMNGILSSRDTVYTTTAELTGLPSLEELPGRSITGLLTALQYSEPLFSHWVPLLDPWEHSCQKHGFSMYDYMCCMSFQFMCITSLLLPD